MVRPSFSRIATTPGSWRSEADWNLIEKTSLYPAELKPKKDMVVKDGQKLTLGDTTLTFYITPGNTAGTLSTIVPLKDGNQRTRWDFDGRPGYQLPGGRREVLSG